MSRCASLNRMGRIAGCVVTSLACTFVRILLHFLNAKRLANLKNGTDDAPIQVTVLLKLLVHTSCNLICCQDCHFVNKILGKNFTLCADFQWLARTLAKNVCAPKSSFPGCFLYASSYIVTMSLSKQQSENNMITIPTMNSRLPRPRRTCIMAVNMPSSVGFDSRTSLQSTSDSSTFWERMRASAFND